MFTFEARLNLSPETDALLSANARYWSWGQRTAWSMLYRQKQSPAQVYAELQKLGFTSHQVRSILTQVQMKHKALLEAKLFEEEQRQSAIKQREEALKKKQKKIANLEKQRGKQLEQRQKLAPKDGKKRSKKFIAVLAKLREIEAELEFCRNWVSQKAQVLARKRHALAKLQQALREERFSLCFGSHDLLAQRPGPHNADTTPYENLADWREDWELARNGQWWSEGCAISPCGNREIQWLPGTKQLRLRLTDQIAHERMDARGIPHHGGKYTDYPMRMQCGFLEIDNVDFTSHKGQAAELLKKAIGQQPVTMRMIRKRDARDDKVWYVQASIEVDVGFDEQTATDRSHGVVQLDLNNWGLTWAAVKPDGNLLHGERGAIPWQLDGLATEARKQAMAEAINEAVGHAERLGMAVGIEDLDFFRRLAGLKAGEVKKQYNHMLSNFPTSEFKELITRACEKSNRLLYLVNRSYSSVGGYAKYGLIYRLNPDLAAALWLGRQAVLGQVYKSEGVQQFVKKHCERFVLPSLPVSRKQSKQALAGMQWRDIARALGRRRRDWGSNLKAWCRTRVEAASGQDVCPPDGQFLSPG